MVSNIRSKIRSICDRAKTSSQPFIYSNSLLFPLTEENVDSVSKVTINDSELASGQSYTYDSDNNIVTLTASLSRGDIVRIYFDYYDYSNEELDEYIKYALVQLSVNKYLKDGEPYRVDGTEVDPIPDEKDMNLIAFIASILIKPNLSRYSLPTVSVTYRDDDNKDIKISKLVNTFRSNVGVWATIEL
jgi:hypothetical protein